MISTLTLSTIQKGINAALSLDPGSQANVKKLLNKSIKINCESPSASFYIRFDSKDTITLHQLADQPHQLLLTGTGTEYVQLFSNLTDENAIANCKLKIEGEIGLLGSLVLLLANIEIDWEDALAALIGDLAAHPLADSIRRASNWAQQQPSNFNDALRDYIHYELQLFPAASEFKNFKTDINSFVNEITSIDQQLANIKKRVTEKLSHSNLAPGAPQPR